MIYLFAIQIIIFNVGAVRTLHATVVDGYLF